MPFGDDSPNYMPSTPTGELFSFDSRKSLLGSSSSHSLSATSSPFPSAGNPSIDTLSNRYPSVRTLKESHEKTLEQLTQSNSFVAELIQELKQLREERKKLAETDTTRQRYANLVSVLSAPTKPLKRPEELPFSVLWDFNDIHFDPDAAPKVKNQSRPLWQAILRNADGTSFSLEDLEKTDATIAAVYNARLASIPGPEPGRPATWTYLRTHHRVVADASIEDVLMSNLALGLCAHNYKIQYLFQHHIQNKANSVAKKSKKQSKKATPPPTAAAPITLVAEILQATHPTQPVQAMGLAESIQLMQPAQPPSPKRKASDLPHDVDPPPAKKPKTAAISNPTTVFSSAFTLGSTSSLSNCKPTVDISVICVSPTLDNLQEIFSSEFPNIEFSSQLLTHLGLLHTLDSESMAPSSDALAFVTRIENADPNIPDLSEDDDNEQWGHHQFTGAELTIDRVLGGWDAVGTTIFACRLLAAFVKTCRVARHLCFLRERTPASSYLSDIYLGRIVAKLWELVKDITLPNGSQAPPQSETIPLGDTDAAARTRVSTLQVPELNKWIDMRNISREALNQKPKKADLVRLIVASNVLPTEADLATLALARRPSAKRL